MSESIELIFILFTYAKLLSMHADETEMPGNNANKYKCIVHTLHSCETSYDEPNIMQTINIMFCVKPILTKE